MVAEADDTAADAGTEHEAAPAAADVSEETTADLTPRGRYIPYSGGSAGWFENAGVMKSERRNNYTYHAEMDLPEVRSKQFLRWGPAFDRRGGGERVRRELPVNLLLAGRALSTTAWDINNRGIRLHFSEAPEVALGEEFSVEVLDVPDGEVKVMLDAQVIWLEEAGGTRTTWDVGIFFPYVSAEAAVTLRQLIG